MNLKEILKAKGLTQRDIFDRTGIAKSTLSRAFSGKPTQRAILQVICQALEVNMEDVTGIRIHSGVAAQAEKRVKRA